MLLPTSIHTTTARHIELIDHINLKNAQITRTSLKKILKALEC